MPSLRTALQNLFDGKDLTLDRSAIYRLQYANVQPQASRLLARTRADRSALCTFQPSSESGQSRSDPRLRLPDAFLRDRSSNL